MKRHVCPHRPACDGCPLFEASATDASITKLDRIATGFRPYPALYEITPQTLNKINDLHYRNRARMAVRNGKLGFYVSGSRAHLPIETCAVHRHEIEAILDAIRPHVAASPLRDVLEFVDVRVGEASVATFVTSRDDESVRGALRAIAATAEFGVSIALGDSGGAVMPNAPSPISEPAVPVMALGELRLEAPPRAFYQVNDEVLSAIHTKMGEMLADTPTIVDAYCGVGTHGLALAEGRKVVGFDVSREAIEAASRNARTNGIDAEFFAVDAEDLGDWTWPNEDFAAIANPARAGLTPEFVEAVASSQATQLLYLSCEPITLSRDLERLRRRGLAAVDAIAFDMMPRTDHVETLVRLQRREFPEREYEGAFDSDKQWPRGVSGPLCDNTAIERTTWFARLIGRVPHGQPPNREGDTPIEVRRVRNIGDQSVARITMNGADVDELRRRLRDWGYPIVGDTEHGIAATNALMARREWVDRPLLHCVRAEAGDHVFDASVPGELLPYFRLPDHKLQP